MTVQGLVVFENRSKWMSGISKNNTFLRVWLYRIHYKNLDTLKKRI